MTNEFQIYWEDLSYEKQQDILETLKRYKLEDLKEEAKEKAPEMSFKDFMMYFDHGYDLCWDFKTKEEKEKYFESELDEFLEQLAMDRIKSGFKYLSVEL